MFFVPQVEGDAGIRSSPAQFAAALRERVARGLLTGQPHFRSKYSIVEAEPHGMRIRAVDCWTAFNVGLNDLEVRLDVPGSVSYDVRYWRWAGIAVGFSGFLGLIGLVLLLTLDVRAFIAEYPMSMIPGLTVTQNLLIAWASVGFWGFISPWLLIGLHKRPVHRLVQRIIAEVDAMAGESSGGPP